MTSRYLPMPAQHNQVLPTQRSTLDARSAALLTSWLTFTTVAYQSQGKYSTSAVVLGVVFAAILALALGPSPAPRWAVCGAIASWALIQPLLGGYGSVLPMRDEAWAVFTASLALLAVAICGAVGQRVLDRVALAAAGVTLVILEALVITYDRKPQIDVFLFVNQAADKVATGNIYGSTWQGISPEDPVALAHGFPYLPMTAVLLAPFRWLFGDARWGILASVLVCGTVLAWYGRRGPSGGLLAALLMLGPSTLLIVESTWTEPLVLALLLPALIAFECRRPMAGVVLLALALATKQHVLVLLPLLAMWQPIGWRRRAASLIPRCSGTTWSHSIWTDRRVLTR
jgi:hypothetical protein